MREIKLANGSVDLDEKTVIATSFQLADVFDLVSRKSNYTNRFRALPTENNKKLFGFANDEASNSDIPYTQLPVKYLLEGMEVMPGAKLTIESADDNEWNLEVFAGCREFFQLLGDKTLEDLTFPSTDDYYALNMGIFEYAYINTVTGVNMALNPLPDSRQLFLSYKKIIEAIIRCNGYTKTGNVFAESRLAALHVFPLGYRGWNNQRLRSNLGFKAYYNGGLLPLINTYAGISFDNIVKNEYGYWDGLDYTTPDPTGALGVPWFTYSIRYVIRIDSAVLLGGATNFLSQIKHNGVTVASMNNPAAGPYPIYVHIQADNLTGGQGYQCRLEMRVNAGTSLTDVHISSYATVTVNAPHPVANYRNALGMMPENIKQRDFFRDFAVRFGVLFSENNNVLICKTYREILQDKKNAVDWTTKRILEKSNPKKFDFAGKYAQYNYFKYLIESGDEALGDETGLGVFTVPNTNLEFKKDLFTSIFTASLDESSGNNAAGYINCVKATWAGGVTDLQLRLVMIRAKFPKEPTIAGGVAAYNVAYFTESEADFDCGWQGFIEYSYTELRQALQRAKLISRKYNLKIVDIASLDQFKLILDSNSYYLLVKINNYVKDRNTTVELLAL